MIIAPKNLILLLLIICSFNVYAQDTLKKDTVKINTKTSLHHSFVPYILPSALITYGVLSFPVKGIRNVDFNVYHDIQNHHAGFHTSLDTYMQFTPAVAVYALNLAGVEGKHRFVDRSVIYVLSEGIYGVSTYVIKHTTKRGRPSNANDYSFPSGHTGNAFLSAELLYQEYKDVSPWYGVAGYAVATATGTLRLYNNAHWFSDVVAGAGIGIASTKLAYLAFPFVERTLGIHQHDNGLSVMPSYQNSAVGFALSKSF